MDQEFQRLKNQIHNEHEKLSSNIQQGEKIISSLWNQVVNKIGGREELVFRGENKPYPNPCLPTLFREINIKANEEKRKMKAKKSIHELIELIELFSLDRDNFWRFLISNRMVSLDSPFIDFTSDFLVSLYFACYEKKKKVVSQSSRSCVSGYIYFTKEKNFDLFNPNDINKKGKYSLLEFSKSSKYIGKYFYNFFDSDETAEAQKSYLVYWKNNEPKHFWNLEFNKIMWVEIKENEKKAILLALEFKHDICFKKMFPKQHGFIKAYEDNIVYNIATRTLDKIFITALEHGDRNDCFSNTIFSGMWICGNIELFKSNFEIKELFCKLWLALEQLKKLEKDRPDILLSYHLIRTIIDNLLKKGYDFHDKEYVGTMLSCFLEEVTNEKQKNSFFYWLTYFSFLCSFDSIDKSFKSYTLYLKSFTESFWILCFEDCNCLEPDAEVVLKVVFNSFRKYTWGDSLWFRLMLSIDYMRVGGTALFKEARENLEFVKSVSSSWRYSKSIDPMIKKIEKKLSELENKIFYN